jgi:hypothetical protein
VKCPPTSQPTPHPTPALVPTQKPTILEVLSVDSDSESVSLPAPENLSPQKHATDRYHQTTRMNELEKLLRTQKQNWQSTNHLVNDTSQKLNEIQTRMDDQIDKLQENVTLTMEGQANLTITVNGLHAQIQRLTQVIDRMSLAFPGNPVGASEGQQSDRNHNPTVNRQLFGSSAQTANSQSTRHTNSSNDSISASSDSNQSCYKSPQKKKLRSQKLPALPNKGLIATTVDDIPATPSTVALSSTEDDAAPLSSPPDTQTPRSSVSRSPSQLSITNILYPPDAQYKTHCDPDGWENT